MWSSVTMPPYVITLSNEPTSLASVYSSMDSPEGKYPNARRVIIGDVELLENTPARSEHKPMPVHNDLILRASCRRAGEIFDRSRFSVTKSRARKRDSLPATQI